MDDSHFQFSYIGTQSDKLSEALEGMLGLLTQMPEATANFENAKEAVLQKIKTERITKQKVIDYYEASSKINIDYDQRKDLYEKVSSFSMEDLREFHNSHVQNDSYTYMVLGSLEELDMDVLRTYGDVNVLTLEDVFGY
jgi:ethanolamine ammonia-lyase large subunit